MTLAQNYDHVQWKMHNTVYSICTASRTLAKIELNSQPSRQGAWKIYQQEKK